MLCLQFDNTKLHHMFHKNFAKETQELHTKRFNYHSYLNTVCFNMQFRYIYI